jgi:hypothetical protein
MKILNTLILMSPQVMDHEWYHRLRMKFGMPIIANDTLNVSRLT